MSYKIRNGETIQLVKVAKIKEGDIKHKYVCGGGGGGGGGGNHRSQNGNFWPIRIKCHGSLTIGFSCLLFTSLKSVKGG